MGLRGGTEANKDITGLYDLSALHLCDRSGLSNPADVWFAEVPGASWRAPHKKVSELDGQKRGRARLVPRGCLMSIDRSKPISVKAGDPIFLSVTAGMTVIVRHLPEGQAREALHDFSPRHPPNCALGPKLLRPTL